MNIIGYAIQRTDLEIQISKLPPSKERRELEQQLARLEERVRRALK